MNDYYESSDNVLNIFWVVMLLGSNNVALMICSKTLPENDYFKAFDSILQIGPRFLPYGVEREF